MSSSRTEGQSGRIKTPNRLALETSPYLKQHAENPVDWYPWGSEALERARREDKPILLSVGYSACHWCHVMAHESFENPELAALMNREFVNVKVDREERPDLDQLYQNVAQIFTRGGGWPLTVFLTPDLKPFYGGTYFPPADRYGRPGFARVLESLARLYREDRPKLTEQAERVTAAVSDMERIDVRVFHQTAERMETGQDAARAVTAGQEPGGITRAALEKIADEIGASVDPVWGGVSGAPKFPNPMLLSFLWRMGIECDCSDHRRAVLLSLRKMALGGIFDQLGGGFHRYSVDETWSVPHFEKMLYDNALLLKLYAEVLLSEPRVKLSEEDRDLFRRVVEQTVAYVLREMQSPEGLFYAAQDADSLNDSGHPEEGAFFAWTPEQARAVLPESEAREFMETLGVTETGNFEQGRTVLFRAREPRDPLEWERILAKSWKAREARPKPGLDDKVLTAWNALMISGLAWAARAMREWEDTEVSEAGRSPHELAGSLSGVSADVLSRHAWKSAVKAFRALLETQEVSPGRLLATRHSGVSKHNAYLDDYAYLAQAALDLVRFNEDLRADLTVLALGAAERLMKTVLDRFSSEEGGFFFTSDDHERLLERPKNFYDQAIPSGTAVALQAGLTLAELSNDIAFATRAREACETQIQWLFPICSRAPLGTAELAQAAFLHFKGVHAVEAHAYPAFLEARFEFIRKPLQSKTGLRSVDQAQLCHRGVCRMVKVSELKGIG